jgi:UDP-N-acetylmuramoyl-tripeptide--D-alanyl-D-alanine ligase
MIFILSALISWWLYRTALENKAAVVAVFVGGVVMFEFIAPVFLSLATVLLWPVDWAVKKVLVMRAKAKISDYTTPSASAATPPLQEGSTAGLTIIGIAGSYGKTTMKEVLAAVLSSKFKVIATPESVNTPVGIARWVLKKLDVPSSVAKATSSPKGEEGTEIAIIEMGEHYRGDVEDICEIARPDIAVVTGINEAHLERMKKMDVIITTIFEIVSKAKAGALVVLNGDDKQVMEHYKEFVWPDHRVSEYKVESIKWKVFNAERLGWEVQLPVIARESDDRSNPLLDRLLRLKAKALLGSQ